MKCRFLAFTVKLFLYSDYWFHSQVLAYGQLMQELDVTNVRELEDFLINECMYAVCSTVCT